MTLVVDFLIFLVTVLTASLGLLYLYFQKKFKHWDEKKIPHAKPSFPFGNLGDMSKKTFGIVFKALYDQSKHEKYYGIWQMHRPAVMVNDPEIIKRVLVGDFMSFHDHGMYCNEKDDPLAANLFSINGTRWRNLRAKLTPTFTSGKMKLMFPIMVECGEELKDVLKEPAQRKQVIEAKEFAARFTTDIISSAAFGIQTNSLKNPDAIFRKMGKKIFEPTWPVMIRTTVAFLLPDLAKQVKLVSTPKDVSKFFLGAIKETMDYREKNNVKRNDVMQLLIQLKNKGVIDDVDDPNVTEKEKFSFELAAAQAFIFFVGGFETSSTTLQFVLYELALNPKIQDKLRAEIRQVLKKHDGKMTYDAIYEMDLLGRVIDETLRKYPPAPILTRICTKDYKLPGTDVILETGSSLIIPTYGLQMDEQYFPDPEKFDPDRFTEEQKQSRHHYTYLPFGEGPRICIGQRFAAMQTRVGLISIIGNYKIEVSPKHTPIPIDYDPKSFIFSPKGGMNLKIALLDD